MNANSVYSMTVHGDSLTPMTRVRRFWQAYAKAANNARKVAKCRKSPDGPTTSTMAAKPTANALHRRAPTGSFSTNADSTVRITGAANTKVTTSTSGSAASAM